MNNCYNCPHRKPCVGSAHSQCTHPIFEPPNNFRFALYLTKRPDIGISINGETALEFNQHGVRNGWCTFPINFDPIWVSCNLPIKTE